MAKKKTTPKKEKKAKQKTLEPYGDRIVVKRDEPLKKTEGGILIPDGAQKDQVSGAVVAVGPGRRNDDGKHLTIGVKPGDRIWFAKYAGSDIVIEGQDYMVMTEMEILGVEVEK